MNFKTVKRVIIPEGEVKKITNNGVVLWNKLIYIAVQTVDKICASFFSSLNIVRGQTLKVISKTKVSLWLKQVRVVSAKYYSMLKIKLCEPKSKLNVYNAHTYSLLKIALSESKIKLNAYNVHIYSLLKALIFNPKVKVYIGTYAGIIPQRWKIRITIKSDTKIVRIARTITAKFLTKFKAVIIINVQNLKKHITNVKLVFNPKTTLKNNPKERTGVLEVKLKNKSRLYGGVSISLRRIENVIVKIYTTSHVGQSLKVIPKKIELWIAIKTKIRVGRMVKFKFDKLGIAFKLKSQFRCGTALVTKALADTKLFLRLKELQLAATTCIHFSKETIAIRLTKFLIGGNQIKCFNLVPYSSDVKITNASTCALKSTTNLATLSGKTILEDWIDPVLSNNQLKIYQSKEVTSTSTSVGNSLTIK